MAWGREEFEWERFSHLMAVVFNASIWDTSKTNPKQPREFNPLRQDETGNEAASSEVNDQSYEIIEKEASRQDGKQREH